MTPIQFNEKILELQQNMFHFAMLLTANRYDAEDLSQETTLRVLDNKEKYVDNLNFKAWVFTIMRNIFINHYKKELRSQTIVNQTGKLNDLSMFENISRENPEENISIKEINNSINSLQDDLRIPFSMYLDGYKYNEISEELSLPLGTIKSRIFFARQELQRNLSVLHYSN